MRLLKDGMTEDRLEEKETPNDEVVEYKDERTQLGGEYP
jgi:hypothetical protein